MFGYLKQSTASQSRMVGPFVDDTDFKTLETGLTIANTDVKLSKNGAAGVNKNSGGGTHRNNGMYSLTFDATDTGTVGEFEGSISVSGALVVVFKFTVLEEAVYDALFASGADIPTTAEFEARTLVAAAYFDPAADTVANVTLTATTTDVTNQVTADITAISGDATAANNLELQYDGTGLSGDTFPSSQSQVASIGTISGGGQPFEIIADNTGGAIKGITFVGSQTGTFANTEAEDGSYHIIDDTGNAIDVVYRANIGGSRIATEISFKGFLSSANDSLNIQAYDFVGADWETILILGGQGGSANLPLEIPLLTKHSGIGADLGDVLIRFVGSGLTNPQLNIDLLHAGAVGATSTLGFEGGAVWLDTVGGTSGVGEGVGFINRPSDNITDALAIAAGNNLKIIHSLPGSNFTLPSSVDGLEFKGFSYTVTLNGKSCSGTLFENAIILGDDSGTNAIHTVYDGCLMGSNTLGLHNLHNRCGLGGDIILMEAGTYTWVDPVSHIAGSGSPSVDFQSAAETKNLNVRGIFGGLEVKNYNAGGGTHNMTMGGNGQLIIAASGVSGSIELRGNFKETDNSGGAVSVVRDLNTQNTVDTLEDTAEIGTAGAGLTEVSLAATGLDAIASTATGMVEIAKAVWDRIISKANHNIGQSAGKLVRQGSDLVQIDGAVSDVSPSTTEFDTNLTQGDTYFDDAVLIFSNGSANAGIGKPVVGYLNANGNMTFLAPDDWPVTPVDGDDFVIFANHVHPISQIQNGLATAAALATVGGNVDQIEVAVITNAAGDDIAADIIAVKADTAAILIDTDVTIPAAISGVPDLTLAAGDIDGHSLEEALKLNSSALAGKLSGAGTSTETIRAVDDSKDRITATVDAAGNRTAITTDVTG